MKEISEYILQRLDFNENKVRECLKDIKDIRKEVGEIVIRPSRIPEIMKLLSDERYRMVIALGFTNNRRETRKLLGMTERTFYRKLKKYEL